MAYEVSWSRGSGAEQCPGITRLTRAVAEYVGEPAAGDAVRSFEAEVKNDQATLVVLLRVRDPYGTLIGERQISGDSAATTCAGLVEATAFAIALSIDPGLATRSRSLSEQAPPPSKADSTASPARKQDAGVTELAQAEPPVARDIPRASVPTATPARLNAWSHALVAVNVLPQARAAVELGFRVRRDPWSARVGGGFYPRIARPGMPTPIGLTMLWLIGGYTAYELEHGGGSLQLRPELGVGIGAMHGFSDRTYGALRFGATAEQSLVAGLRVEGTAQVHVPWSRSPYEWGQAVVWRPAAAGLTFGVGLAWQPD